MKYENYSIYCVLMYTIGGTKISSLVVSVGVGRYEDLAKNALNFVRLVGMGARVCEN